MKVTLNRKFAMPASADTAWVLLQDIAGVAACMPGAKITERIDATHYKGTVAMKVGPASLSDGSYVIDVDVETNHDS